MDYGSVIWDPYLKSDVDKLERIQKRAARFITGDYKSREEGSVTKMLEALELPTLQSRRGAQRLIYMYKVVEGLVPALPPEDFITFSKRTRLVNTRQFKDFVTSSTLERNIINNTRPLVIPNSKTDQYKHSFFIKTALDWNKLPETTVFYDVVGENREFLTREDLKVAMVELFGYKPSKYEANQILSTFGMHYDSKPGLSLPQFIEAMTEKLTKSDLDEHIRHAFMAFDVQCKGFLTVEDLRKAFGQVAPHIPQHTIETTFRELDRDGDGRISFKDFDFMMKYNIEDHI